MFKAADTWVALDPSFKQYESEVGYDMHALLNFDGQTHFMAYLTDPADLTPYQYFGKMILDYLNASLPDWTSEGLYGHERISPIKPTLNQDLRQFAASLPYTLVTRGYAADTIPEALRHKVTVELAPDALAGPDVSVTIALSELGNDRLTLSYVPASAADDAVVNDYGSLYSAPAYLINVKPQLRRNGTVVATGSGMGLGANQTVTIQFHTPTLTGAPIVNQIKAGSYSALVFQGSESALSVPSVNMQRFSANVDLNEQGLANLDDLLGQLLHNMGIYWFFNLIYERDFYASTLGVVFNRLPSQVITTADITVSYWFGIPRTVELGTFSVDADTDTLSVAALNGEAQRRRDFALLAGLTGSAWERLANESVTRVTAVSAVKLVKLATQNGIPVHRITSSNMNQILPVLALAPEDIIDIRNAINAGREVIVSQQELQVNQWRGAGIITIDPELGSGVYLISGGLSGSGSTEASTKEWQKSTYRSRFKQYLYRSEIMVFAKSLRYTPYAFGCKDPLDPIKVVTPSRAFCDPDADLRKNQSGGIDCSGLVAWAFDMGANYIFFKGKNAQGQNDIVSSLGKIHTDPQQVELSDLGNL